MNDIVTEIIEAGKILIQSILVDHSELYYADNLDLNACGEMIKRFGFIAQGATFVEGRSMGFTTMDHDFQIILTDEFNLKDDDRIMQNIKNKMFGELHEVLKDMQKKKLVLATPTNLVTIINGSSFEVPEVLGDNMGIALKLNLNIQYRFKNN